MLNRQRPLKPRSRGELDQFFHEPDYITYADITGFARRYAFIITLCTLISTAAAIIYVLIATPLFTTHAKVLIDPSATQLVREERNELLIDSAHMESQVALIVSDTILHNVVRKLKLDADPEFTGIAVSSLERLRALVFGSQTPPPAQVKDPTLRTRLAVEFLRSRLDVHREGLSYVITIAVTTASPEKSALIVNAMAQAYEQEQVAAKTRSARASSAWLEDRIRSLRGKLDESARQLQDLRAGRSYAQGQQGEAEPQITVEAMEATVESFRKLYETYLQALTKAVEQESFSFSNARVITPALPSLSKSYPRGTLIVIFGAFAGLLLGVTISFLRLMMDNTVRTPKQVKTYIGLECLARIPKITRTPSRAPFFKSAKPSTDRRAMFQYITEAPFSQFAGAVTALKNAIVKSGRQDGIRSLGITSALPEEGKSTLSANLATAFALSSYKTLIIDADVHNSVTSQTFAPDARIGLLEVLKGEAEPQDCIVAGKGAVPDVLPVVSDKNAPVSYSWLSSDNMVALLKYLKDQYHLVVVDLPPLAPVAEGLTISGLLDSVILAVEWGKTPRDVLADVTYGLNLADANILGIVLTKVDEGAVHLRLQKAWKYY
jgi:capsular exopolysaccharide synthesis family protein